MPYSNPQVISVIDAFVQEHKTVTKDTLPELLAKVNAALGTANQVTATSLRGRLVHTKQYAASASQKSSGPKKATKADYAERISAWVESQEVDEKTVTAIRNGSLHSSPTVAALAALCEVLGA